MNEDQQTRILPKLSTVIEPQNILQHPCGSNAFFAWGIKIMVQESFGKHPRLQGIQNYDEVVICAKCLGPVVFLGGIMYDASEFITKAQIDDILMYGQARNQAVPLQAMDI